MKKKIIGITGATGVLGKYFIKKYKNYNYDIFEGDITNNRDVKNWIKKTEAMWVFHFASKVSTQYVENNFKNSLDVNYYGTKNLIDNIISSNKRIWFFFASSSHVYKSKNTKIKETDKTKPITLYGKTKIKAENYLQKVSRKKNICIGRIFSFTDKKQREPYLIPSLFKKINRDKKKIFLENLNHDRDFCHLDDICRAINLLKKKSCQGVFNIGSGKETNLLKIAKLINTKKKFFIYKNNHIKTSLIADITKIMKVGFKPKFGIKRIILDFYKK